MNQNFASGGTPDDIHNGTDNTYWAASDVIGSKSTFDSTDRANSGTKSALWDNPSTGDIIQFAKGSDVTMANYVSLTIYVNIDQDWDSGDNITLYWYDTSGSATVGTSVNLEDYLSISLFDSWQKVSIPLSAFGAGATATTADALRFELVAKSGKAPKFYIDDMQIEETGEPGVYEAVPSLGKVIEVSQIQISMVKAYSPVLADSTMPKIPYDSFLGTTLTSGLTYQRVNAEGTLASAPVRTPMDVLQVPGAVARSGSDGTNTWLTLTSDFGEPLVLRDDLNDKISYTISEDLSGFLFFRVFLKGRERDI